jgi:hypothetical protein
MARSGRRRAENLQSRQVTEEVEPPVIDGCLQGLQEEPAIEARQHFDRQEEAGSAANPSGTVGRRPAARHDTVDMGMMVEVLAPGVQNGDQPDLGAEMLGVAGDNPQRLRRRLEQDGVDDGLVLEGDLANSAGRVNTTWKYGTGNNSA